MGYDVFDDGGLIRVSGKWNGTFLRTQVEKTKEKMPFHKHYCH
jgi:hypothetical protein